MLTKLDNKIRIQKISKMDNNRTTEGQTSEKKGRLKDKKIQKWIEKRIIFKNNKN